MEDLLSTEVVLRRPAFGVDSTARSNSFFVSIPTKPSATATYLGTLEGTWAAAELAYVMTLTYLPVTPSSLPRQVPR